jgi:hypothetical protein
MSLYGIFFNKIIPYGIKARQPGEKIGKFLGRAPPIRKEPINPYFSQEAMDILPGPL